MVEETLANQDDTRRCIAEKVGSVTELEVWDQDTMDEIDIIR